MNFKEGGIIGHIERRIAEYDYKIKLMQTDLPRNYHGFAKELEKTLDYQASRLKGLNTSHNESSKLD